MPAVDSRLVAALSEQLGHRDALLRGGARRVGWKLGLGRRERIGDHIAIGYLTTATVHEHTESVRVADLAGAYLHVDAELCVELRSDHPTGPTRSPRPRLHVPRPAPLVRRGA